MYSKRNCLLTLLLLLCASLSSVSACHAAPPPGAPAPAPTLFGTLQTQTTHAADEYAGGERLAMMELDWRRYEPSEGVFDAAYAAGQRRYLEQLRAVGFKVTLGLGTHYTPRWLANMPGARFVDQKGAQSKDVNFVFNQKTRRYLERYLKRIDADLGLQNFWAIRIDSGGNGELLYPNDGNFWAFDANAQNGPDRPADLPLCPTPGWKPGDEGLTPAQIRAWGDWYVRCLALTADWQMRTLDKTGFTGWYQILTPGSGVRPSRYERDIQNRLQDGLFGVGAVWQKVYEFLPHKRRAVVYISSVGDRSGGDDVTQPGDVNIALTDPAADRWSATRWQVRLAGEYGLPVGGENPGFRMPASLNSPYVDLTPNGMMAHALAQAKAGGFQCFYWAHSERLWDGTVPFAQYAKAIADANADLSPGPSPGQSLRLFGRGESKRIQNDLLEEDYSLSKLPSPREPKRLTGRGAGGEVCAEADAK